MGPQMEAKAIKKPLKKTIKNMMPKMSPNWSQRDPQMASPGDPPPKNCPNRLEAIKALS